MRAVGADPLTTGLDGLPGIGSSIVVGSMLAVVRRACACPPSFPSDRSGPSIPTAA